MVFPTMPSVENAAFLLIYGRFPLAKLFQRIINIPIYILSQICYIKLNHIVAFCRRESHIFKGIRPFHKASWPCRHKVLLLQSLFEICFKSAAL